MTKESATPQLTFTDRSGNLIDTSKLFYLRVPDGLKFIGLLEKRNFWNNRPGGLSLFLDQRQVPGKTSVLNSLSWQLLEDKEIDRINEPYSSLLVNLPGDESFKQPEFLDNLKILVKHLKENSPCYIFETKNTPIEKTERLSLLEGANLCYGVILEKKLPGFLVWEGRTEASRKREPIDLTDKLKRPKGYGYTRMLWAKMAQRYQNLGFKIINSEQSEILARIRASKNPRYDWNLLEQGHGVVVKNIYCGCTIKISLNGDQSFIWHCRNKDPNHLIINKLESNQQDSVLDIICADCGDKIHERIEKSLAKEITIRYCPSCGWETRI